MFWKGEIIYHFFQDRQLRALANDEVNISDPMVARAYISIQFYLGYSDFLSAFVENCHVKTKLN